MDAKELEGYELVERDGVAVVLINDGKVLLLKRWPLPLHIITAPGVWTFLTGGKGKKEEHIAAAYREIREEVGLTAAELQQLSDPKRVLVFDPVYKDRKWYNMLVLFHSNTQKIRMSFENMAYRWAGIEEIEKETNYTNIFADKEEVLKIIRSSF